MSTPKTDGVGTEHQENNVQQVLFLDEKLGVGNVTQVQASSVALAAAVAAQKPSLLSKNMIQLYMIMSIGYLVSTLNGFGMFFKKKMHKQMLISTDSSLMGSINAMKPYQQTMGLSGEGSSTGIVFIIYNLGQIAAFPFCGFLADGYGRRVCIFVGCLIVVIGTAVQATANDKEHYMGGRFILGMFHSEIQCLWKC
jgi:hypothetical protein